MKIYRISQILMGCYVIAACGHSAASTSETTEKIETVFVSTKKPLELSTNISNLTFGDETIATTKGYKYNIPSLLNANKIDSLKFKKTALEIYNLEYLNNHMAGYDAENGNGKNVWKHLIAYDSKKGIVTFEVEADGIQERFAYQIARSIFYTYDFLVGKKLEYSDIFNINDSNASVAEDFVEEYIGRFKDVAKNILKDDNSMTPEEKTEQVDKYAYALETQKLINTSNQPRVIVKNDTLFINVPLDPNKVVLHGYDEEWAYNNLVGIPINELQKKWKKVLKTDQTLLKRL